MTVKDSESEPAPLKEIPQMHVQDFAQVPNNVGAEGKKNDEEEKDNVEDALKDFQNTLKEVLSDDKGAENAMQSMEQMMQFLKQNIEEAESKDGTTQPTQVPQQPAASNTGGGGKTFLQKMMESTASEQMSTEKPNQKANDDGSNPFAASMNAMFNDFERVKTDQDQKQATG